jgi:hypothetical protein
LLSRVPDLLPGQPSSMHVIAIGCMPWRCMYPCFHSLACVAHFLCLSVRASMRASTHPPGIQFSFAVSMCDVDQAMQFMQPMQLLSSAHDRRASAFFRVQHMSPCFSCILHNLLGKSLIDLIFVHLPLDTRMIATYRPSSSLPPYTPCHTLG